MDVGTLALSGQTAVSVPFVPAQGGAGVGAAVSPVTVPAQTVQAQLAPSPVSPSTSGATTLPSATESASLQKSAASLNQNSQPQFGSIEFSVDQQSNKMVLKVVDQETKQVLLQIPSKEALILSETVGNGASGSLIHESA